MQYVPGVISTIIEKTADTIFTCCVFASLAPVEPIHVSCSACAPLLNPLGDNKIATVGLYGAKKVVAFAKAVLKGRKEASKDEAAVSSAVAATNDDDEDEAGDEAVAKVRTRCLQSVDFVFVLYYLLQGKTRGL